jgi:AcrR family transcriptional regulator
MPRPRATEEHIEAMRERILDAAYAILLEKGSQALSSRAIAEEVGVAHMALYTYFENQQAILQALAEREALKMREQQEQFERRANSDDIVEVMRAALSFFPAFERDNPNLFHLSWVLPQQLPERMEHAQSLTQSNVEHLADLVQRGIEQGVFTKRDPRLAAAAAFGMVTFPLILFHSGRIPSPQQRDRLVAEMLDAAITYLRH